MKKLFLLVGFISFFSFAQKKKNDFELDNLKGNVKSIRTIPYSVIVEGNSVKKGDIYRGDIPQYENTTIVYKQSMRVEYRFFSFNGDLKKYETYSYDNNRNLTEWTEYDIYENPQYVREYKYDAQGREVSGRVCASNDDYCLRNVLYDYTEPDTKKIQVESDSGDLLRSYIIKYDKRGNLLSEEKFDSKNNTIYLYTFTYNDENLLIEKKKDSQTITYKYNKSKDCIQEIVCEGINCNTKTFEYTYDKHNNWIQKIEYLNQKPTIIIERTIDYD